MCSDVGETARWGRAPSPCSPLGTWDCWEWFGLSGKQGSEATETGGGFHGKGLGELGWGRPASEEVQGPGGVDPATQSLRSPQMKPGLGVDRETGSWDGGLRERGEGSGSWEVAALRKGWRIGKQAQQQRAGVFEGCSGAGGEG